MKVTIYSDRKFILNEIRQISSEIEEEQKTTDYNSVIENAISELIKIDMRELAHRDQSEQLYSGERILSRALDAVRDSLASIKPAFDFSDYFRAAERRLRIPARELLDLRTKLRVSREKDLTGGQTSTGGVQPFSVKQLGLKGAIEGLLIFPLSDAVSVDLDKLTQTYSVEGEWFPFQVKTRDLTFVIDDDGSIFTSTEHFSETMMTDARRAIEQIARQLYS